MNDQDDAMENVNMAEADRTKERLETKKKKAFARYQDALAGEESGAMDGGAVLPHYDDIDPVTGEAKKPASSTTSFTLGEQGAEQDAKRAKLEAIKAKLAKGTGGVRTGAGRGYGAREQSGKCSPIPRAAAKTPAFPFDPFLFDRFPLSRSQPRHQPAGSTGLPSWRISKYSAARSRPPLAPTVAMGVPAVTQSPTSLSRLWLCA